MSVNNADFQIQIKTYADNAAIDQTSDKLKKVGEVTRENTAQDSAQAEIKKTLDQATGKVGETAEEAGQKEQDATERTTLGHREKREALRAVLEQFGKFGDVGLLLEPELIALAATLAIVEKLKARFEELNSVTDQFNDAMASIDAAKLQSAAKSASDLRAAMGEIADKADEMESAFNRSTTVMENQLKLYNEQIDAIGKKADAEEKAFEAELAHQVALGHLTQPQADAQKEAAKLKLDALHSQNEEAKLGHQINVLDDEFSRARLRVKTGADRNAIADAVKAAAGPEAEAAAAAAAVEAAKRQFIHVEGGDVAHGIIDKDANFHGLEELNKAIQKTKDEISEASAGFDATGKRLSPGNQQTVLANLSKQLDALQGAASAQQGRIDTAQTAADIAEVNKKHAEQRIADAKAQSDADTQLATSGAERIKSLQEELRVLQETNAAVNQANARAAASRTATENTVSVGKAFEEAQALEHKLATTGGTAADWKRMADFLKSLHDSVQGGQQIDATLIYNIKRLELDAATLKQHVADLDSRMQKGPYHY